MDYFHVHHHDAGAYIAQQDANDASRRANSAHREVESLRAQLDRVHLAAAAMWELLRERVGVTDEELLDKVREIDLRDGALDGRIRQTPRTCDSCDRVSNGRRTSCLYCGRPLPPPSPLA